MSGVITVVASTHLQVCPPQIVIKVNHTRVLRVGCCICIEPALAGQNTGIHTIKHCSVTLVARTQDATTFGGVGVYMLCAGLRM